MTDRNTPSATRILLNIAFNWGGQLFSVSVAFFLAPFVVHHLGNSAYGVWTLTRSLAGYMALMDLGVRGAVTRYFARFLAKADHEAIANTAASAMFIFSVMAVVTVLSSSAFAVLAVDHFNIPSEYQRSASLVVVLAGLTVGATLIAGVFGGILAGLQRFDTLNTVEVTLGGTNAFAIFLALHFGDGIVAMAAIQLVIALSRLAILVLFSRRFYPQLRVRPSLATRTGARMIFSFSVFSFLMQVSGNLIYYTDAAVIAAFLPIGLLAFFAIGGSLVEYTRMLVSCISQVMSPLASAIDAQNNPSRVEKLLLDSATFSMAIVLPIAVTFLLRGRSFIALWMGPSFAPLAGSVLFVLALPLLFHGASYGTGGFLLGIGKHKALAPLMLVEGFVNIVLSIILVQRVGIVGVAWGTTIPNVVSSLVFWPWYIHRTVGIAPVRYMSTVWVRPAAAVLPFALATYLVERFRPASNLYEFIIQVAACVPLALAGMWPICLTNVQRRRVVTLIRGKIAPVAV